MRVAAVCGAAVLTAVGGTAPVAGAVGAPGADLVYHGSADMVAGRVDVRFTPHNHGPGAAPDSAVRIRWSQPLADRQTLPAGCARAEERAVLCRVGALAPDGVGERIGLRVRLRGAPTEVLMEFDTVWSDGAVDEKRGNDQRQVLVLDTGDTYHF
ncbi:hypothetical protein IM697_41670 [Streptomyces ferrugineus]|uniref:Uncharacterized protein n=1 Tax=Streptomyces ferrugineus TaxID=1413221 RepID=A0A7M2T184_9ACTN|nr:hypothetical protein [Streptomyces ferrugineus]QOV41538.1 hypothetical protein IM697_41670 [Streptomyces ferrugineus]